MKKNYFMTVILLVLVVLGVASCGVQQTDVSGKVKVTFDLQGGEYKNSKQPVSYYFGFAEGATHLIKDMFVTETGYAVKYNGYEVEGWYRTKNADGTFADKWNFESDIVGDEGVTLYANWQPEIKFTYQIVWVNPETGDEENIGIPYVVDAGKEFSDTRANATKKKPTGYTFLNFTDKDGNDWDSSFKHPGGTESTEVKVYAKYIKGNWAVIRTATELIKNAKMANLYLMNDIDLEGASFSFGNFSANLEGNGHKISNFSVAYVATKGGLVSDINDGTPNVLYISLLGNVKNATVKNVTFENVTIDVNATNPLINRIYVCPLCANATASTLENVVVKVKYTCTATPWDADDKQTLKAENLYEDLCNGFLNVDEKSVFNNVAIVPSN